MILGARHSDSRPLSKQQTIFIHWRRDFATMEAGSLEHSLSTLRNKTKQRHRQNYIHWPAKLFAKLDCLAKKQDVSLTNLHQRNKCNDGQGNAAFLKGLSGEKTFTENTGGQLEWKEKEEQATPRHSLTGPVGWPFVSRLGGHRFMSRGCTRTSGTGISC